MIPYGLALLFETVFVDIMFGWKRIDAACAFLCIVLVCQLVTAYIFTRVTVLAALCLAPLALYVAYLIALTAAMWTMNGPSFERTVGSGRRGNYPM